jgi:methyl-accepting chemotaxis protein
MYANKIILKLMIVPILGIIAVAAVLLLDGVISLVAAVVFGFLLLAVSFWVYGGLAGRIVKLGESALKIADGDFKKADETGEDALSQIAGALNSIVDTLTDMDKETKKILLGNNELAKQNKDLTDKALNVENTLLSMSKAFSELEKSHRDGHPEKRFDAAKFEGEWRKIASGVNTIIDSAGSPIKEISVVFEQISKGRLNSRLKGGYKGNAPINAALDSISDFVSDISSALSQISSGNYNVKITNEYKGDLDTARNAFNHAAEKLNKSNMAFFKPPEPSNNTRTYVKPAPYNTKTYVKPAEPPKLQAAGMNKPVSTVYTKPPTSAPPSQLTNLAGMSRQNVQYDASDSIIFENKD